MIQRTRGWEQGDEEISSLNLETTDKGVAEIKKKVKVGGIRYN